MRWLSEHVESLVILAIVVVSIVFGHIDEKKCADACGTRGYSYNSGCTGPTVCLCGGTVSR